MIDSAEVIGFSLSDFGVQATVNGEPLTVIPCIDGSTELAGEMIELTVPFALAAAADVAKLDLQAGNNGDTLTLGGVDYTVMAIDPDALGFSILKLAEQ